MYFGGGADLLGPSWARQAAGRRRTRPFASIQRGPRHNPACVKSDAARWDWASSEIRAKHVNTDNKSDPPPLVCKYPLLQQPLHRTQRQHQQDTKNMAFIADAVFFCGLTGKSLFQFGREVMSMNSVEWNVENHRNVGLHYEKMPFALQVDNEYSPYLK